MSRTVLQQLAGKRVGVALSAGYFGFFGHAGFMAALHESGIRPVALGGTSAGGMIAAFTAAGVDPKTIHDALLNLKRADFWDPSVAPLLKSLLTRSSHVTGLLQGNRFLEMLKRLLPVHTFEDLQIPLMVIATNLTAHAPEVISRGDLASAVLATCAYPGMFQAVRREQSLLWDGGIVDKCPALALVDHFDESLDAVLVHYLPSHDELIEPAGVTAYASGIAAGMSALRSDHFRLQLEVLKARKFPTWVMTSRLPAVSPTKLKVGQLAWTQARALTLERLHTALPMWTH